MISNVVLAGVAGWPVAHSLSPLLHNYWLRECGISGAYVPLAIRGEDFSTAVDGLRRAGFAGLNVTLPHKIAAAALAQELDAMAQATGAANLLVFRTGGAILGRNTDVEGLAASLVEELGAETVQDNPIVILGAGGAARASILAVASLGAREIHVLVRDLRKAEGALGPLRAHIATPLHLHRWPEWPDVARNVSLVINATSAGMAGATELDLTLKPLPKDVAICDLIYNPLETDLIKRARARGNRAMNGLGMLMHQAVPAFAAFFGLEPKVTPALRDELERALRS